ncbi:hypothetical protein NPIL_278391 [Nephila pilipes]|uniref:Uncharacterized protein n=1 Tax=Nephila pilipes TaxID=299642 RepID=A0A8X6TN92_NEPPI|nr:hypothetical protein NPIL_278391 [Nephila pilipes]
MKSIEGNACNNCNLYGYIQRVLRTIHQIVGCEILNEWISVPLARTADLIGTIKNVFCTSVTTYATGPGRPLRCISPNHPVSLNF